MNRNQRDKNRHTARILAEEVFEANLPHGLRIRGGVTSYDCPSCGGDREWFGSVIDFDPNWPCGGSERCIP